MKRGEFRALSLRQKLQWVLQYYGVAIAVAIVALTAGISFFSAVFGPGEKCAVKVMILDERQSADNCQGFAAELGDALGGTCEVTCYNPGAVYEMQAFAVRLTSDELDVIIAPGEQMREMQANGYLLDMARLEVDSRYQTVTRGGAADGDIYIGRAARGKNEANASFAMRYFMESGTQSNPGNE